MCGEYIIEPKIDAVKGNIEIMLDADCFATPDEAEVAFYQAFSQANLDAMMSVWASHQEISCIHPGGERLYGQKPIMDSWRKIFAQQPKLQFTITDSLRTQDALLAIHLVKENISMEGELLAVMLATNIYQLIDGSWRMVLHHASPEPKAPAERTNTLH